MTILKRTIMRRDELTEEEADALIQEAKDALATYLDEGDHASAEDICEEFFGLESDYIFDLM